MDIKIVQNREEWEAIVKDELTQSWVWGDFLEAYGIKIWRLGIYDDNKLIAVALARLVNTKLRKHICVTNGPILQELKITNSRLKSILTAFNVYLSDLAKNHGASFFRIEFPFKDSEQNREFIENLGYKRSAMSVQAEVDWLLDIGKDEQSLLGEMRKSTRYDIKQAIKSGIKVYFSKDLVDFEKFWTIFEETYKRQGFTPFPKSYLLKQLEVFGKEGNYFVSLAADEKAGQNLLAGAIFAFYKGRAHYLQAASANLSPKDLKSAPKLILWEALKFAKQKGCTKLDFHGIAPNDDPKHPWYGITQFKKSFGGYEVRRVGAYDYSVSPWYNVVRFIESNYSFLRRFRK